ncbi:MAG: hypothetical protein FWD16_05820, partial [Clostridia bacterium]|nr:hypothetical protein [Clostridia bacterium]
MKNTRFHITRLRAAAWLTALAMLLALIPLGLAQLQAATYAGYTNAYGAGLTPTEMTALGLTVQPDGTAANPWLISTGEELLGINDQGLDAHYRLMSDVSLADWGSGDASPYGFGWPMIGVGTAAGGAPASLVGTPFTGSLDGGIYNAADELIGVYKITDLYINGTAANVNYGLFSWANAAEFKNFEVVTANISGVGVKGSQYTTILLGVGMPVTVGAYAGPIKITNVTTRGILNGAANTAAFFGTMLGEVKDSTNYAAVTGPASRVGGFGAWSGATTYTNCINYGAITGQAYVGGIAASGIGTYTNCANFGALSANSASVAGFIGGIVGDAAAVNPGNVTFTDCISVAPISSTGGATVGRLYGGIVGGGGATSVTTLSLTRCAA